MIPVQEAPDDRRNYELHLGNGLRMVKNASIHQHVVLVDLLLPLLVELFLCDLADDGAPQPSFRVSLLHVSAVEFQILHRQQQPIIHRLVQLDAYVQVQVRLYFQLLLNYFILAVNTVRKIFGAPFNLLNELSADFIDQ